MQFGVLLLIAVLVIIGFALLSIGMGWQFIAQILLISIPITDQKRGLKNILKAAAIILFFVALFLGLVIWRVRTL
jgi:MFS-type transporter involved in bile tolerance (Atg22 family)